MADASDSKSDVGDYVWVQVPSPAFLKFCIYRTFFYDRLSPVECGGVFRVPKNGGARNKKSPAMRVVQQVLIAQKSPFRYDRVVQTDSR